jgi:hypothetical protein
MLQIRTWVRRGRRERERRGEVEVAHVGAAAEDVLGSLVVEQVALALHRRAALLREAAVRDQLRVILQELDAGEALAVLLQRARVVRAEILAVVAVAFDAVRCNRIRRMVKKNASLVQHSVSTEQFTDNQ